MTLRGFWSPLVLVVMALFIVVAPRARAQAAGEIDRLGEWFDANPESKNVRSSGWKPYNRLKWLAETRRAPAGMSAGRLRWEAVQVARARTQGPGPSSRSGWFSLGPSQLSGRCVSVDFHPTTAGIVYVGSASGGLWKSTDGGDTWATSTDDLPTLAIGAVCVLATNPDIVLIGTGEGSGAGGAGAGFGPYGIGLFKSTDAGATWNPTSLSFPLAAEIGFNVIEDNPTTGTILAGTGDGIWRSTDQGDNWTQVESEGNWFDVKWKPGDVNRVYATKGRDPFGNSQTDNGVRVSTDDGQTFAPLGTGQPSGGSIAKTKIAVTVADPSVIYAHYVANGSWTTLGIYRSTDDGATWQVRNNSLNLTGGQGWYNNIIGVAANNADRVIAGGVHLYTSDDGGQTYTDLNADVPFGDAVTPHWDNHALVLRPGFQSEFWIGTDGGVWRSTTDGASWQSRREGIVTYQFYDICVAQSDPEFTMGGTQDNGIPGRVSDDIWFESTFVADGFVCNIDPTNANSVISEWQFGNHIRSANGGQSWVPIQNGITGSGSWVTPVDQDQNDPLRLFTWANTGIYRTTNRGNFWQNVSNHHARWISISPVDGDVVWTISHGPGVYHSTDGGDTWARSTAFSTTGQETKIQAHPVDTASAFATVGGYSTGAPHILLTTDFGGSWSDVTGDFPDQPANTFIADPAAPGDWYVGSDTGVWKSTNGGVNWVPFGNGLPHAVVVDLEIRRDARKLVAGTYGRGVWEAELPTATDAGVVVAPASRNLMLDPPRPHPVRDHAVLRFGARGGAAVTLDIYDVGGRRVSRVADLPVGDGLVRTVNWWTSDVPGGVYFAVLRAGEDRISRKIVVRK